MAVEDEIEVLPEGVIVEEAAAGLSMEPLHVLLDAVDFVLEAVYGRFDALPLVLVGCPREPAAFGVLSGFAGLEVGGEFGQRAQRGLSSSRLPGRGLVARR